MSQYVVGEKWLVTCTNWFYGPDGKQYRAAFGTVRGVLGDEETLGIRTNRNATNWYLRLGSLVIAGCQIHYATRTDICNLGPSPAYSEKDGALVEYTKPSDIFDADGDP